MKTAMYDTHDLFTKREVYAYLHKFWHIETKRTAVLKKSLSELDFSATDINWMLNALEWRYHVSIALETVPPQQTLEEFATEVAFNARTETK